MTTEKILSCLVLAVILIQQLLNLGSADAAKALYVFGDSFATTGNGGYTGPPWGMTWPGYPAGRACDGRNQVDYFAELLRVPYPTPSSQLKNESESLSGVNFAQAGAAITYAFGWTPLDTQVNQFESLVQTKALSKYHLRNSVALVSLGVNDYGAYNENGTSKKSEYADEVTTLATTVVDGIALNLVRLHSLGFRNIIVANLAVMACSPFVTVASNYSACSNDSTLAYETLTHNTLLERRVRMLKLELRGANFVIVDQTKAFEHIFHHGAQYGFEKPLIPCCTGKDDIQVIQNICGSIDSAGQPLYKVCQHPERAVVFDSIHPTQAAWKVVIDLYASVPGFTHIGGPTLHAWIHTHRV